MEDRITLPPISDIFYAKGNTLGSLPSLPSLEASVPMMSFHPQQYSPKTVSTYASIPSYGLVAYTSSPPALHNPVSLPRSMQGSEPGAPAPLIEVLRSRSDSHWASATSSPQIETPGSPAAATGARISRSRTRNNLPKETTLILLKWLNEHINHPYPNSFEKTRLMMATGLSQQQLSNWFINARRRKIKGLRLKKLEE